MTCDTSVVTCDTILAHNISQYKSSHVKWPRSQVATCDTSSVTGSHLWHRSLNMWRFYTVIYWRGYFTVDHSHVFGCLWEKYSKNRNLRNFNGKHNNIHENFGPFCLRQMINFCRISAAAEIYLTGHFQYVWLLKRFTVSLNLRLNQ